MRINTSFSDVLLASFFNFVYSRFTLVKVYAEQGVSARSEFPQVVTARSEFPGRIVFA